MAQIRRGDPEIPLGYRRIETSALAQAGPVDAKRFLDSLGDRLRDRGRDHPVAGTHEQGVVEMVAQRLKIAAQRRLRKLKLVGREGDAFQPHHGLEYRHMEKFHHLFLISSLRTHFLSPLTYFFYSLPFPPTSFHSFL